MATDVENAVNSIVEELTFSCSICMENSDKELVAYYPCLHYACVDCAENWRRTSEREDGTFTCHACRKEISVPLGGLQQYQDAHKVNRHIDNLRLALQGLPMPIPTPHPTIEPVAEEAGGRVEDPDEQRVQAAYEEYSKLVRKDKRCDMDCRVHLSCKICCFSFMMNIKDVANNVFCELKKAKRLLMPIYLLLLMKTLGSCMAIYLPNGIEKSNLITFTKVRRSITEKQPPLFKHRRISISMLMIICLFTVISVILIFFGHHRTHWIVASSINGTLCIMWSVLLVLDCVKYQRVDPLEVRGDNNMLTYFSMEQLQQYLSELSLYPTLCMAAMSANLFSKVHALEFALFVLSAIVLLVVFLSRLYTAHKLKTLLRNYYHSLMYSFVGNYLVVIALLALLLVVSSQQHEKSNARHSLVLQLTLVVLIAISTTWNQFMFYLSHLYEISLQSAVNILLHDLDPEESQEAKNSIEQLLRLDTFHKTMYAMSVPLYAGLLFFWIVPSLIALVLFSIYGNSSQFYYICAYFIPLLLFNAKTALMSLAGHFTFLVAILFCLCVILISLTMAVALYIPLICILIIVGFPVMMFFVFTACKRRRRGY